ncbi:hypothetical protein BPT24_117 [Tenacibaculum phage pT24]|uniref:Uncharacterized protein n=1 Tax=Tenacibaculum phage pT24 TaxID=1880590 RepID=A0A1B4XWQ2_9CAUD|nr:hypothetical protein HYP10_gp117 [Tenacibaculum phage pT24]BAV39242.1 hypothetical protein BPT24_117 [Tenacibaculum phage pT24]
MQNPRNAMGMNQKLFESFFKPLYKEALRAFDNGEFKVKCVKCSDVDFVYSYLKTKRYSLGTDYIYYRLLSKHSNKSIYKVVCKALVNSLFITPYNILTNLNRFSVEENKVNKEKICYIIMCINRFTK